MAELECIDTSFSAWPLAPCPTETSTACRHPRMQSNSRQAYEAKAPAGSRRRCRISGPGRPKRRPPAQHSKTQEARWAGAWLLVGFGLRIQPDQIFGRTPSIQGTDSNRCGPKATGIPGVSWSAKEAKEANVQPKKQSPAFRKDSFSMMSNALKTSKSYGGWGDE